LGFGGGDGVVHVVADVMGPAMLSPTVIPEGLSDAGDLGRSFECRSAVVHSFVGQLAQILALRISRQLPLVGFGLVCKIVLEA
jgi:hypothetical protein